MSGSTIVEKRYGYKGTWGKLHSEEQNKLQKISYPNESEQKGRENGDREPNNEGERARDSDLGRTKDKESKAVRINY